MIVSLFIVVFSTWLLLAVSSESWVNESWVINPWSLGNCYSQRQGFVNRSDTVIKLLVNDWMSHQITSFVAAIILREFLGYQVEIFVFKDYFKAYKDGDYFRRPLYWDVDLENWRSVERKYESTLVKEVQDLVDHNAIDIPRPIGYSGRDGLYVLESSLDVMMSDYYKVYSVPGYARSHDFLGVNTSALRAAYWKVGSDFPECINYNYCGRTNETYGGYYIPPWCEKNMSACIEVWMGPQGREPGYFEQLAANNGPLYMIFAYHSPEAMKWRRMNLVKHPQNVVFYSWSPNWGADGQGAIRLSFPDTSNSCMEDNPGTPEGPIKCDMQELILMRLVSKELKERAPEAFFFLQQFTIQREKLYTLFKQVEADESEEGLFKAACRAVQSDTSFTQVLRTTDWACTLGLDDHSRTFHSTVGICRKTSIQHDMDFQCYGDRAPRRLGKAIRIAKKNWASHEVMQKLLGILLTEKLGYDVAYEDAASVPGSSWGYLLESGIAHVEPESWWAGPDDPSLRHYVDEKVVVLPPTIVGWLGRSGLYVTPETLKELPFSDYYRFFQGTRARDAGFTIYNETLLTTTENLPWVTTDGYYSPPACVQSPESCIELIMQDPRDPFWEGPSITQLVRNHELNVNLAWYGESGGVDRIKRLHAARKRFLFYYWTPTALLTSIGIDREGGRVSFPDWYVGCDIGGGNASGRRECDMKAVQVRKLISKELTIWAPDAVYLIENFMISDQQINLALEHMNEEIPQRSPYDTACWLLKNQSGIAEVAAPACITNPKLEKEVRIGDRIFDARSRLCRSLQCRNDSRIEFRSGRLRKDIRHADCAKCASETPGTVPSADQLQCIFCEEGQAAIGGVKCVQCPSGKFTDKIGKTECEDCDDNRYNPLDGGIGCTVCPTGGSCQKGSSFFTALPGYYILGGDDGKRNILRSFLAWRNSSSFDMDKAHGFHGTGPFHCPAKKACVGDNRCLEHKGKPVMEGPFCGSCAKGFTHSYAADVCSECRPPVQNYVFFCLGLIAFALLITLLDRVNAANVGNLRETKAVVMKILCNFFIILSILSVNCNFKSSLATAAETGLVAYLYSRPLLALLNVAQTLENPGKAIFSVQCLVSSSGYDIYPEHFSIIMAWMAIPCILIFAMGVLLSGKLLGHQRFKFSNAAQSVTVLIMYFMHPMVTSTFLGSFNCVWLDQETKLEYGSMRHALNMKIDCESPEHVSWMWIAGCGVVFWSFGIPLTYWLKLRRVVRSRKKSLHDHQHMRKFGFLYDGFEPEQYYYETIFMIRKAIVLMFSSFPWLLDQARTVLLLALTCVFLSMDLKDQPFDNRAYFGLDRLQNLSSITLILLLLGRLLEQALSNIPGQILEDNTMLAYIPALISLVWFLSQALYLLLRSFIWPLDGHCPLLPTQLQYLDHRLVFTMIPESNIYDEKEHSLLGVKSGAWRTGADQLRKLNPRERMLLKSTFTEALELILRRHELCVGRAPAIICLPSLLVQLERVIIICMSVAIRSRIKAKYRNMGRDTWWKLLIGLGRDSLTYADDLLHARHSVHDELTQHVDWSSKSCVHLCKEVDAIQKPVSAEELHVALMNVTPTLLDVKKNAHGNELRRLAFENKGILDMSGATSWIFEKEGHLSRLVQYNIDEDGDENSNMGMLEDSRNSEQELPHIEVWEDPLGNKQSNNWEIPTDSLQEAVEFPALAGIVGNRGLGPYSACRDLWNLHVASPQLQALTDSPEDPAASHRRI